LHSTGLHCPSAHYALFDLLQNTEQVIAYAHELGLQYIICSFPAVKNPPKIDPKSKNMLAQLDAMIAGMTLDDWKWNAEQLNRIGEQTRKAGIRMGYHNHDIEFRRYGATTAYDELLRATDPKLVTMELDCGWVKVAGHDPVAFLQKYPARYSMLHVKDETVVSPPQTSMNPQGSSIELGRGKIDYKRILTAAAATGHIRHYFVEQEEFPDLPVLQAIRVDYEYLHHLQA
jgi:sugar phosphate isomerase/epimerase